ncbi:hypothetical protein O7598_10235 [Micromonospora sp. WMMC241]|uniref:hypothetical protein n=1 Tax=Micromonospora sp. WMMC241 TaxID=3015159 RepID=UPI0022B6B757|nr:hypothetical protein [Micromonospora sp. WMMC241]MCZ7436769.1 hypothetical protein [Micromonospora sp. WMMC241]
MPRLRWWALACAVFVVAELALRAYWIAGGRWGYTACDRTDLIDPASGCGADQVETLPLRAGWVTVGVGVVLAVLVGCAVRFPGRLPAAGSWAASALLLVLAFPLHLLFEIPAALAGRPSDWRDLGTRLALAAGGLLFAGLADACAPQSGERASGYQPVPRWTRRWAYVAAALPVVGWAVPHGLWVLGVPFGIPRRQLADIRQDMSTWTGLAITVVPPLAGLLVLGLAQRWGQRFPLWVPGLRGRSVPRLLAVIPAGVVTLTLVAYGVLSVAVLAGDLIAGHTSWSGLRQEWAVAATPLVFLGWGVALGVTTSGYVIATGGSDVAHESDAGRVPHSLPERATVARPSIRRG